MPRELDFDGILLPTLLLMLPLAAALYWLVDGALARAGLYRLVWHPALFRVCLFVCLFAGLGLAIYGH